MPTLRKLFGSSKHDKGAPSSDERPGRSPPGSRSSSPERSRSQDRDSTKRGRSLSPFPRKKRDESLESLRRVASEDESGHESDGPVVCPSNAFDETDDDEDDFDEDDEEDTTLLRNTTANASSSTYDLGEELTMVYPGEGPNLEGPIDGSAQPTFQQPTLRRRTTKSKTNQPLPLVQGRPVFERNRCSLTITQGKPDDAAHTRKSRTYIVASDLSDESTYAIQWAIGTVLRDADQCIIVTVMETDTKFDPAADDQSSDRKAKMANQKERQVKAAQLARQATSLLERTKLHVRVTCSAIHAKSPRHLLVDMIDYIEPTMCIVGTRGRTKISGMLLGSVSNYLVQKSSSPVMVTRRPLRVTRTVHKKISTLNRENRVRSLAEAAIDKESHGGERTDDPVDAEEIHEEVEKMTVSEH